MTLCTECSTPVKPIVAVDIDGTLGKYHQHFTRFFFQYWAMPIPEIPYQGGQSFSDWIGCDKATYRETKLAYRQGGGKRTMPLYKGAQELMRELPKMGAEVWLTTTRPYLRLDSTDPDTRFWLRRHGIAYDYLLYDEDKYQKLADRVDWGRVVMVLDDLTPQLASARGYFGDSATMIQRDSNSLDPWDGPVARDLTDAKARAAIRIAKWKADQ